MKLHWKTSVFWSISLIVLFFLFRYNNQTRQRHTLELGTLPISIPKMEYGLVLDTFLVETQRVKFGQNLGYILNDLGISMAKVDELVRKTKDIFDFTQFKAGQTYKI
jgi:hypothetical protein